MKKFVSLFLALTLTCTLATIPSLASSNRHGYDGYIGTYDMDPNGEWVKVGELSHSQVQAIKTTAELIAAVSYFIPKSKIPVFLMSISVSALSSSDNGNGVIIYSWQYPNGCDFCGSGYRVEAR